ncbi:MAG: D-alanyl-D-alanine carboxypeptidase family protein [Gammaproteobacteria bacterium]|nr:D-alanyl-D-alanine carboxypeptidase family protein [Gammaproteobacteria bacterium]
MLHASLGIAPDYEQRSGLPLQLEPAELADAGLDMFGRAQSMTPETLLAWRQMLESAAVDGVELLLVSAFRSVDYQARLIQKKLDAGRTLDDILRVNAAPGFSEHHTGRAVDIATPGDAPLEESFEKTNAFKWLQNNAGRFGFVMSYPRSHRNAISYEPWHWCFQLDQ